MLWVNKNCPQVKHFILNDIKPELVNLYRAIQKDAVAFTNRVDELQSDYLPLDKPSKKSYFYSLRDEYTTDWLKWDSVTDSGTLYFLMKTAFNGIWQTTKTSNGRFATPVGLCNHTTHVYDKELIFQWSDFLQKVSIYSEDWATVCETIDDTAFYFMDPPYRDSFTSYGETFSDDDQIKLIDFCKAKADAGNVVFYCNRDSGDGFFDKHRGSLSYELYDIKYTAGRRKKESDGGFSAKAAKEILLHSPIDIQYKKLFDFS